MIFYLALFTIILTLSSTFHNYHSNKNIFFLSGYLLPLCLYSMQYYFIFQGNSVWGIAIFQVHIVPLLYLPGAMLYLYVRVSLKKEAQFSKKDLWHLLPFGIGLLNVTPYYFVNWQTKLSYAEELYKNPNYNQFGHFNLLYPLYTGALIRCSLFFIYVMATLILLAKYWKSTFKELTVLSKKNLFKWLSFLSTNALLLAIYFFVLTFVYFTHNDIQKADINALHYASIAGLSFCLIPIVMIFYPQVVYGIPVSIAQEQEKAKMEKDKINQQKDALSLMAEKILMHLETEKPYLNKEFSLNDLANALGIPKHQLYVCLNNVIQKKFTQLRTSFRIEHAKKLLLSPEIDSVSLQGIWMESGFSSKTNFYTTFKEETGLTPTEFIQQHNP